MSMENTAAEIWDSYSVGLRVARVKTVRAATQLNPAKDFSHAVGIIDK